jgi:hypothetical protein
MLAPSLGFVEWRLAPWLWRRRPCAPGGRRGRPGWRRRRDWRPCTPGRRRRGWRRRPRAPGRRRVLRRQWRVACRHSYRRCIECRARVGGSRLGSRSSSAGQVPAASLARRLPAKDELCAAELAVWSGNSLPESHPQDLFIRPCFNSRRCRSSMTKAAISQPLSSLDRIASVAISLTECRPPKLQSADGKKLGCRRGPAARRPSPADIGREG